MIPTEKKKKIQKNTSSTNIKLYGFGLIRKLYIYIWIWIF